MGVILNNLIPIIGSSIAMSIPLVLASVGGAFSVRSGIMALGLESMMMMGAFFGVLGSYFTGSVLFGFLLGMVGGMVIGLFHGILSVRYKVNQVISGIGLNLLALAVTTLLMQLIWNNKGSTPQVASISTTLDFFAPIPVIGPILAQQSVSFLVMVAAVVVGWIVLFKTRFGLRLRMVGENPKAAATMACGFTASSTAACSLRRSGGVGGAYLSLDQLDMFVRNMTAGRGYIRGGHRHPGPVQPRADRALRPAVRLLRRGADLPSGRGLPAPDRADAPLHCDPAGAGLRCQAHQAPGRCR